MKDIILFGKPGVGKDSLAEHIVDKYNYKQINMGKILREMADRKDPDGLRLRDSFWGAGNLVPDHESGALALKYIRELGNIPLVFNGYPRNRGQVYDFFENMAKKYSDGSYKVEFINMFVEDEIAIKRLLARGRVDDTEEIIRKRIEVYNRETKECKDVIEEAYKMSGCDLIALGTKKEVRDLFDKNFWDICICKRSHNI